MGFLGLAGFGGGATGLSQAGGAGDLGASGGVVGEYTEPGPGNVYRVHVFQSPGTFIVTDPAVTAVEYLVVAGGGGGSEGDNSGGGGGAGGFRTNVPGTPGSHTSTAPFPVSTSPGEYSVTVGQGGIGASKPPGGYRDGFNGADSSFGPITATGGGWGGGETAPTATGHPGGSGGGGSTVSDSVTYPGGAAIAVTTPSPWPGPATQGFAGGSGRHTPGVWESGGGGGGAGHAGQDASPSPPASGGGAGGIGIRTPITGPAYAIGYNGSPTSIGGWIGGGGAGYYDPGSNGGGGAWDGSSELAGAPLSGGGDAASWGYPGRTNSGGGGGATGPTQEGGNGGPGIVAVRYQISEIGGTAQATGGNVSFYEGKTIHAFTASGSLVCPTSISDVEYVIVGGGGGGGAGTGESPNGYAAGGGGAGQYLEGSGVTLPATTYPITVGQGGDRWVRW